MQPVSANFGFLKPHGDQLFRLVALAEHYFRTDPNTCLFKLRQFGELLAQDVAARSGLLATPDVTQAALLGELGRSGAAPRRVLDLFHLLRRSGNEAAHEGRDDFATALTGLKIARELAAWFVRSYGGDPALAPGPFTPPPPPADPTTELRVELERLRAEAEASRSAEAAARVEAERLADEHRTAQERAAREAEDRAVWQKLAEDAEAAAQAVRGELAAMQATAQAAPPMAFVALREAAGAAEAKINLDEAATRELIDQQLRDAGWESARSRAAWTRSAS